MNRFQHFQKYQTWYEIGFIAISLSFNALVNATTQIMDEKRDNLEMSFYSWEPFVWEFSSLLAVLCLLPAVIWFSRLKEFQWLDIKRTIPIYFLASLVFSILHVCGMVIIRKVTYWSQSMTYQFGDIGYEFFYEYRKDLLTFIFLLVVINGYLFIINRLQGEANLVSNGEDSAQASTYDRFLVKKLGKEFIIKISEVEWLEASGNYVNLYVKERIYPIRNTLAKLVSDISEKGFCRVHRSYAVNLDAVDSIKMQSTGSGEVTLKSGKVLSLSRRYHGELKERLYL